MMNAQQNLLKNLRDIHLPDPISWWPPAPGWYVLLLLVLVVCYFASRWCYRRWRKHRRLQQAIRQLHDLEQQFHNQPNPAAIIAQLAVLIKQIAILTHPRQAVASLTGRQWLRFLDRTGDTDQFSKGCGQLLLATPYQATAPTSAEQLFSLVESWIRKCL